MHVSRRNLLLAGALAATGACTSSKDPRPAPVDPDDAVVAAAAAREHALVAAYDAALRDHPALSALLTPLREEHLQHLTALLPGAPAASPSATTAAVRDRPERRRAALKALEAGAAREHGAAALAARSRSLAQVLATLAASEASHGVVL